VAQWFKTLVGHLYFRGSIHTGGLNPLCVVFCNWIEERCKTEGESKWKSVKLRDKPLTLSHTLPQRTGAPFLN
jgi:hypothetical protein